LLSDHSAASLECVKMLKIRTLLPLILTVLMSSAGGRARTASEPDHDEDDADEPEEPHAAVARPAARRRGRPPTRGVRISLPAASSRAPRLRPPAAQAENAADSDAPNMQTRMSNIEQQLQQLLQAVGGISSNQGPGQDQADDDDDDEDFVAGAPAPRRVEQQQRSIPPSDLMTHIPRHKLAWWDNHPSGTPIAYKDLPGQLRQAMDKNPRDRLEVQQIFTALTLVASLLDAFVAITADGQLQFAQFGMELILNHLFPLLARRVDALQQEGALRSVFMSAQDPRSQYFIADPDTSYGILQKVSSARVQALMAAAGRRGGRDDDDDRRTNNRRGNRQRQGPGGSPQQRARDRGTSTSRNNNANSSSRRTGTSRERGDPRERRGSSRDGAASRSQPADSSSRGADHN